MYIPKNMEVTDLSKQLDLIRAHPLGTLFNYNAPNSSLISYFTGAGSVVECLHVSVERARRFNTACGTSQPANTTKGEYYLLPSGNIAGSKINYRCNTIYDHLKQSEVILTV